MYTSNPECWPRCNGSLMAFWAKPRARELRFKNCQERGGALRGSGNRKVCPGVQNLNDLPEGRQKALGVRIHTEWRAVYGFGGGNSQGVGGCASMPRGRTTPWADYLTMHPHTRPPSNHSRHCNWIENWGSDLLHYVPWSLERNWVPFLRCIKDRVHQLSNYFIRTSESHCMENIIWCLQTITPMWSSTLSCIDDVINSHAHLIVIATWPHPLCVVGPLFPPRRYIRQTYQSTASTQDWRIHN